MSTTWFITGTSSGFGRLLTDGTFALPNDARKIAEAMIGLVDSGAAPLRLPLGVDTYADVRASLVARLAEHDAQREVALSVAEGGPE